MEYSPADSKAYGITLSSSQPASVPHREKQRGETPPQPNEGPAKPASGQTAPGSTPDPLCKKVPEIERSTETPNDGIDNARSSSETTAPNAPPTAGLVAISTAAQVKRDREEMDPQLEAIRKRVRRNIARFIGHEDDPDSIGSDEERDYWKSREEKAARHTARFKAEEARRNALTPEERRREDIEKQTKHFRDHLKPRFERRWNIEKALTHYPTFLLQVAPWSNNGAGCRLDYCTERILPGDYRIAVIPGQNFYGNPELLDLSSPRHLARFDYDRKKYIPDYGAMCILKEYLQRWKVRIGVLDNDTQPAADPASDPPHSDAGPSNSISGDETTHPKQSGEIGRETAITPGRTGENQLADVVKENEWSRADNIYAECREYALGNSKENCAFSDIFPAWLKDGDSATDWKITNYVSDEEDPDYDERHSLSKALFKWKMDARLANKDSDRLDERDFRAREDLGQETIEKIKKYASVHMPAYQGLDFSPD